MDRRSFIRAVLQTGAAVIVHSYVKLDVVPTSVADIHRDDVARVYLENSTMGCRWISAAATLEDVPVTAPYGTAIFVDSINRAFIFTEMAWIEFLGPSDYQLVEA